MAASNKEKPIIEVKHLSKQYSIGMDTTYKTLCESLTSAVTHPLKTLKDCRRQSDTFWALKDVNFKVDRGEVLGIIGRNGAGKSTLLKILSRITYPTEGEVRMRGRVGSLLEVGTGFHPELSGRENIYFNGSILGMKKREIDKKFDEIVKFSGVEKFLDTPVKRYSSGMQVRLAFSVAANLDPEILVVDEVLAVGDAEFQKKCMGKMGDVAEEGKTVLFVSHNLEAVKSLCQKGILLNQGKIIKTGQIADVVDTYTSQLGSVMAENNPSVQFTPDLDKEAQILKILVKRQNGQLSLVHDVLSPITVSIEYVLRRDIQNLLVACQVRRSDGYIIYSTSDADYDNYTRNPMKDIFPKKSGHYLASVTLPMPFLNTGIYELVIALSSPRIRPLEMQTNIYFEVIEANGGSFASYPFKERREGLLAIPLLWQIKEIRETSS